MLPANATMDHHTTTMSHSNDITEAALSCKSCAARQSAAYDGDACYDAGDEGDGDDGDGGDFGDGSHLVDPEQTSRMMLGDVY